MPRNGIPLAALTALIAALAGGCPDTVVDVGGRMSDQASVQAYEEPAPAPPEGAVPVGGGEGAFREAPPGSLRNPVPDDGAAVEAGRVAYGRACVQCHGKDFDGEGTVGRSFAPLPADLRSAAVRALDDDRIFRIVSFGSGRCPPLHSTLTVEERWRLVRFLRSLEPR